MARHDDAAHTQITDTEVADENFDGRQNAEQSPTAGDGVADEVEDYDADRSHSDDAVPAKSRWSPVRLATVVGVIAVVSFASLSGWLGFREYQSRQAQQQRDLFVQVGRQGAINLTTIDWQHADADIKRILDSATGAFYDDFAKRSKPFIEVVQKAQSKSVGTVTEAGLESQSGDQAQVLVAVSVSTTSLGSAEPDGRHWRMRMSVQKTGNEAKISDVAFVP